MRSLTSTCLALLLGPFLAAGSSLPAMAGEQAIARAATDKALEWGPCPGFMPEGCQISVLHGNPGEKNADIYFRVPGGAEIPRHWHHSPERMVLVSGKMSVTYDGQEPVVLSAGTYAYGPAQKPHSAECLSEEACTLFIAFVQPVDAMKGAPDG